MPIPPEELQLVLDVALVSPEVFELRPDYRVLLVAASGLEPGPSDASSESLLERAEGTAKELLSEVGVDEIEHVAAWRDAYRAFGAKPQRTRNSLEALTRRAAAGLPRINRLADIYNAISVLHRVPIGGEDLDRYFGSPRLVRASGAENFDTTKDGEETVEHPEPGEVVWRDDEGVTCRLWNWRQCRRTALSESTTSVIFIFDALAPMSDAGLEDAGAALLEELGRFSPKLVARSRTISNT